MLMSQIICVLSFLGFASQALSQSHAMVDRNRSSWQNNMFLTQSVEGEYGRFTKSIPGTDVPQRQSWRGYGIRNGVGLEIVKFVQFSLSHTMLSLRANESSLENAQGSRVAGEVAFSFSSPLGNILLSGGLTVSDIDYQKNERNGSYTGTGRYLGLGLNYFFNPRVSMQVLGKRVDSQYSSNGGAAQIDSIHSIMDNFSLGIAVWL